SGSAFWYRRQAQETMIHRYDAERTFGQPAPFSTDMAVDGIDEALSTLLPTLFLREPKDGLSGSVHLHATDTEGEWWIGLSPTGHIAKSPDGAGTSRPVTFSASSTPGSSHWSHASGGSTTGMRSWIDCSASLASVVMITQERTGSPSGCSGSCHTSQSPANAI